MLRDRDRFPGTWPPGFSREDFESGVSLRRNKAISRVLMRLDVIEGYGSGYDRIVTTCRDGGYPEPEWIENGPQIKVVIRPHPDADRSLPQDLAGEPEVGRPQRPSPAERRERIVAAIDDLERPNARDIQEYVGIPRRTLARDLADLQTEGLVEFVGTRRGGFYQRQK